MKLSAQELKQLVDSKAFEGVPTTLALEEGDLSWEGMTDNIRQQAARTIIWEAGQRISALFDAYGDAIEEVSLAFGEGYDNGPYFDISITINGEFCCAGDINLPAETMKQPGRLLPLLTERVSSWCQVRYDIAHE